MLNLFQYERGSKLVIKLVSEKINKINAHKNISNISDEDERIVSLMLHVISAEIFALNPDLIYTNADNIFFANFKNLYHYLNEIFTECQKIFNDVNKDDIIKLNIIKLIINIIGYIQKVGKENEEVTDDDTQILQELFGLIDGDFINYFSTLLTIEIVSNPNILNSSLDFNIIDKINNLHDILNAKKINLEICKKINEKLVSLNLFMNTLLKNMVYIINTKNNVQNTNNNSIHDKYSNFVNKINELNINFDDLKNFYDVAHLFDGYNIPEIHEFIIKEFKCNECKLTYNVYLDNNTNIPEIVHKDLQFNTINCDNIEEPSSFQFESIRHPIVHFGNSKLNTIEFTEQVYNEFVDKFKKLIIEYYITLTKLHENSLYLDYLGNKKTNGVSLVVQSDINLITPKREFFTLLTDLNCIVNALLNLVLGLNKYNFKNNIEKYKVVILHIFSFYTNGKITEMTETLETQEPYTYKPNTRIGIYSSDKFVELYDYDNYYFDGENITVNLGESMNDLNTKLLINDLTIALFIDNDLLGLKELDKYKKNFNVQNTKYLPILFIRRVIFYLYQSSNYKVDQLLKLENMSINSEGTVYNSNEMENPFSIPNAQVDLTSAATHLETFAGGSRKRRKANNNKRKARKTKHNLRKLLNKKHTKKL